jgi:hypothetical protein
MAHLNNFAPRFRKGLSSPFTAFGRDWCDRCRTETASRSDNVHSGTTYGFKRCCLRCGKVLAFGVYDNVPVIAGGGGVPAQAVEWAQAPGEDRR